MDIVRNLHLGDHPRLKKQILIRSACNSAKSSRALCEKTGLDITPRRVRQVLNQSARVKAAKMVSKFRLSQENIQKRFQFAISHMSWVDEWKKVFFFRREEV